MLEEPVKRKFKFMTATRLIVFGFGAIIFIGAGLLMLPFSTKNGIDFLTALFTATSATCVTGLTVVNVFDTFTVFGQIVILLMIQLGGLGFMSTTSFLYLAFSKRVSLNYRLTMREDITDSNVKHIKRIVARILILTFATEAAGAIILSGSFSRYMSGGVAVWNGVFTSVSAFCNAGLDIVNLPGGGSMLSFASDPLTLLTVAMLIIIGGLGFLVASDMWDARRWKNYKLHTKIVLLVTLGLILFGTFVIFGVEFHNPDTMGNMTTGEKLLNAFFQSVTARTAGFNSVDIASLEPASRITLGMLMFIGASPGSTGGGIKTTTLFILIITVWAVVRKRKDTIVDKQSIGVQASHKASTTLVLALTFMVLSLFALSLSDGSKFTLEQLIFEQISAYATVGLSLGITAGLSVFGRIVLLLNMFLGRVGALTFFISFTRGKDSGGGKINYPECSVDI